MIWSSFQSLLRDAPLWILGVGLFAAMCLAAAAGHVMRRRRDQAAQGESASESQEGYIVSAVVGLLALLLGFTFALAVDRFDTRRVLVLEEANAIRAAYLETQVLPAPDRQRISGLLQRYTTNRIALARARRSDAEAPELLARNEGLIVDIWTATVAVFPAIKGYDFSSTYLDTMNGLVAMDAARKAARAAHVPAPVFAVLFVYIVATAGLLGYVMTGPRGRRTAAYLVGLLTLSLLLIVDIDRPTSGRIRESQLPMEALAQFMAAHPPAAFDRLTPAPPAPPAPRR